MNLIPIKNKTHYNKALERINELGGAKRNTEKGDELDVLMLLVEKYEEEHYLAWFACFSGLQLCSRRN